MSENKFIKRLKGQGTAKSVLEIKNQSTKTSFANMPLGTSNANDVYSDHRGNATGVLKGSDNWKLNNSALLAATDVYGDGRDFTSTYTSSGNTLWVDSMFTFDSEKMFTPNTKFVLKLCGYGLNSATADTIDFTLVVKLGSSIVVSKDFKVKEQAFEFSQEFDIDFDESNTTSAKFTSGDTMQVQLLCGDPTASATIYNGMTVFTALQRRVDGDSVASDKKTFDEAVQDIDDINEELDDLEQYVDDTFVRLDGTSIMTGPLKMAAGSMRGAFSPYFNGVAFWKMDSQNNITQIATLSDTQFLPATTNATNLGNSTKKWKDLYLDGKAYVATINNGADVAVPAYTGTMVVADFTGGVSGQFLQLNNSLQPVWHTVVLNDISDVDTSNVSSGQVLEYDGTKWAPSSVLINNYSIDAGNYTAGSGTYAITRFSLILEKPDGSWEKPTDTTRNYTTDTDKAVNTNGFLLNQIKYYNHTSTLGNGAVTAMNKVYSKSAGVPMSYSTNCGTTTNWTLGSWVYLVGSIGADGLFYLDTTQWWSDALPTTNDGKVYIQLGKVVTSGTSSIALLQDRPIYFHNGTSVCEYTEARLNDKANIDLDNLTATGEARFTAKANTDLDNLTSIGSNIANWSSNVTNCITEIPQDIKLELNNGTLTLKAGSKVYVPNGFEQDGTTPKFDEVVIESDVNLGSTSISTTTYICSYCPSLNVVEYTLVNDCTSGTSYGGSTFGLFYNTSANTCQRTDDGGSTWREESFPFCIINTTNGVGVSSIDQVFNGFGYIGSTVFALPGVKGLIPNGRNADGTLKNKTFTLNTVIINTAPGTGNRILILNPTDNSILGRGTASVFYSNTKPTLIDAALQQYWFNPAENIIYKTMDSWVTWTPNDTIVAGTYVLNTTFDSFNPKIALRALDYNDTEYIAHQAMPSNKYIDIPVGASDATYTAPADGWVYFGAGSSASGQRVLVYRDGLLLGNGMWSSAANQGLKALLPVKKGDIFHVIYTAPNNTQLQFYYANGVL